MDILANLLPSGKAAEGLNLSSPGPEHPSGPPKNGELSQSERAFQAGLTFLSGATAINISQLIGAPLKLINEEYYDTYMAFTKQSFAVLVTAITQWWSPTVVKVSGDETVKGQFAQAADGSLKCNFPHRIVMMANHQLYTDWLYLWWIAYTNGMHGRIYIILKESLRKIPIIGWGAQFYNFIFLARKWEQDKTRFHEHLQKLNNPKDPMWLLIFPEGTNLSSVTREKSRQWAEKNGIPDMKHQLLPRSTGLQFCLQELRKTTEWLYDVTVAYEGIPPGQFGQDIFTLRSSFFEGRPPKSVNLHIRRFKVSDIPIDNHKAFDVWLRNRWTEKDHLLEYFAKHNHFPQEKPWEVQQAALKTGKTPKTHKAKTIETEIKSGSWEEFLSIFAPVIALITVLFLFYGGNKESFENPNGPAVQRQQIALTKEALQPKDPSKQKPVTESSQRAIEKATAELAKSFTANAPSSAGSTPTKATSTNWIGSVKPVGTKSTAPSVAGSTTSPKPQRRLSISSLPANFNQLGRRNSAHSVQTLPATRTQPQIVAQRKSSVQPTTTTKKAPAQTSAQVQKPAAQKTSTGATAPQLKKPAAPVTQKPSAAPAPVNGQQKPAAPQKVASKAPAVQKPAAAKTSSQAPSVQRPTPQKPAGATNGAVRKPVVQKTSTTNGAVKKPAVAKPAAQDGPPKLDVKKPAAVKKPATIQQPKKPAPPVKAPPSTNGAVKPPAKIKPAATTNGTTKTAPKKL